VEDFENRYLLQGLDKEEFLRNSLILSILLHLLLLGTTVVITWYSVPERHRKPPQLYIPSYVYTGSITPSITSNNTSYKNKVETENKEELPAPLPEKTASIKINHHEKSILDLSRDVLRNNQLQALMQKKDVEPILLVGDENEIADPLVRLIGKALSAHFNYPQTEGMLGIKGKVLIQLTLHPEGYFSDVQIVRSSQNENFDAAALYAVNTAPKLIGVNKLLPTPKHFIVGFLFR